MYILIDIVEGEGGGLGGGSVRGSGGGGRLNRLCVMFSY